MCTVYTVQHAWDDDIYTLYVQYSMSGMLTYTLYCMYSMSGMLTCTLVYARGPSPIGCHIIYTRFGCFTRMGTENGLLGRTHRKKLTIK